MNNNSICILSDSHGLALSHSICNSNVKCDYELHQYPACSAMGLNNENSRSGYRHTILNMLQHNNRNDKIIFKFGQVDVDFVYHYKCLNNSVTNIKTFSEESIHKYILFIKHCIDCNYIKKENVIICSIFPNPIESCEEFNKSLLNLHFISDSEKDTFRNNHMNYMIKKDDRLYNSIMYNKCMEEYCFKEGLLFLDIFSCLINNNELVLYNNDCDHHLSIKHIEYVVPEINVFLKTLYTENNTKTNKS